MMIKTLLPNGTIHYTYALGEGPPKKKPELFSNVEEVEKLYFSAAEVSAILKESQSCIRLWNDQILQNDERFRTRRIYTKEILAKLHIIKDLIRVQKYTILGVKQKMKNL